MKESKYDIVKSIIAIVLSATCAMVFFGMALGLDPFYYSDSPAHIDSGIAFSGYGLETIIVCLFSKFAEYPFLQLLFALYETVCVIFTWEISQRFIRKYFHLDKWLILIISTGLVFLATIYMPWFFKGFYMSSLGTQPWHNSTYLPMRLFGVLYLFYLMDTIPTYNTEGISASQGVVLAIILAVTTASKPNFLFSLLVVTGVFIVLDLVRDISKKTFINTLKLAATFIPSVLVLIVQYVLVYINQPSDPSRQSGIELTFFSDVHLIWQGRWMLTLIMIGRLLVFPCIVLVMSICSKREKNIRNVIFNIGLELASIAIFALIQESGPRVMHGAFGFGAIMTFYTMMMYLVPEFFEMYSENKRNCSGIKLCLFSICYYGGILFLIWTAISGVAYFCSVSMGLPFYQDFFVQG